MEIRLASLLQGAQEAAGTTIIIDVFRAFTTAAVAFDRGATQIVLVAEVDEALDLRRDFPLRPLADGDQQDRRSDPDHHAQHRERGTKPVLPERLQGRAHVEIGAAAE